MGPGLSAPMATRRAITLALGLALSLGGCGFQLRGSETMAFQTAQITGFAGNSTLANELARALQLSGVRVVESSLAAAQAAGGGSVPITHIVIDGLSNRQHTGVSGLSAFGQVRTVTLSNFLRFQVKRADGSQLVPVTDVALSRDMTYKESDALAKQDETKSLQLAMQGDIVGQVMRRLAAIRADQLQSPPLPERPAGPVTLSEWEAAREAARQAREGAAAASSPGGR